MPRRSLAWRRANITHVSPAAAVEATDVRKRFGRIEALAGLSLSIYEGEIYGLLGPNGSGKTTFIRCVAGLVRPEAGRLAVFGVAPRVAVSAGRVGYMTQTPALYSELTVDENLRFFAALQGMTEIDRRIEESLRTVDLLDRRRSVVATLSGGMRTRISLASTLFTTRACCFSTSRLSGSIRCCAGTSGLISVASRKRASPSWFPATSWTRRRGATGSASSAPGSSWPRGARTSL